MRLVTQTPDTQRRLIDFPRPPSVDRGTSSNHRSMNSSQVNASRGSRRSSARWGFAVMILAQSAVTTHAVTLWNQRDHFKEYYHRRFRSDVFGEDKGASSTLFSFLGKNAPATTQDGSCDVGGRPIRAQSQKQHRFIHRFSRLSKRIPSRPVDCCSECQECMSPEALGERCHTSAFAVPRGGHVSGGAVGAAETIVAGAAEAMSASAADAVTPYGIPLNVWKIIFQAMLTTINVVCWLVPLRSKKISENKLGLSLANAFSGGVFLSLAFGHLIPECVHGFNASGGKDLNEALPYMIVLGGYLLIFFVEKVAFDAHEILHDMQEGGHKQPDQVKSKGIEKGSDVSRQDSGGTGRSAVILLGALAVHSILEMTALGLADTFGDSALLSLSIALHQPAESIALLVAFLKSGMPKPEIVKFLSIFSCMGPIGVAIGMAVNSFASPVVDATMLAVVAGTFVYVGATEVIPEEWEDSEHKWKKFLALLSGIGSIFAITQYTMTLESH